MLATIIVDSFSKAEIGEIASALDTICSPADQYAFSSAAIYAFWSLPKQELLYIGLARDITKRFKQHTGLAPCKSEGCKSRELAAYFTANNRIGYSIIVQSSLDSVVSKEDEQTILLELDDDAETVDVGDIFGAVEYIKIAEGMLVQLFTQLGDRLPKWNKVGGLIRGRDRTSFYSLSERMKYIQADLAGVPLEHFKKELEAKRPYELLLNLEASELSDLNAKATIREIANNATYCGHEEFLHGVRIGMISADMTFDKSLQFQLKHNGFAQRRYDQMKADGYLDRTVSFLRN